MGKIATYNQIYESTGYYVNDVTMSQCPTKSEITAMHLLVPSSYSDNQCVQEDDIDIMVLDFVATSTTDNATIKFNNVDITSNITAVGGYTTTIPKQAIQTLDIVMGANQVDLTLAFSFQQSVALNAPIENVDIDGSIFDYINNEGNYVYAFVTSANKLPSKSLSGKMVFTFTRGDKVTLLINYTPPELEYLYTYQFTMGPNAIAEFYDTTTAVIKTITCTQTKYLDGNKVSTESYDDFIISEVTNPYPNYLNITINQEAHQITYIAKALPSSSIHDISTISLYAPDGDKTYTSLFGVTIQIATA